LTGTGNVAAVDCGSLSTRLLISGPKGETLVRLMRLTGLGRGVDSSAAISAEAAERVVSVLVEFRELMDDYGVERSVMVGTSALRDATNRADFSRRASNIVGTELRVLSGEEEALFSFRGATAELVPSGAPWLVADIGGGSTELAAGPPVVARSLDLGCVRVTERFFAHDPPLEPELRAAREWLGRRYAAAQQTAPALGSAKTLVGLAGTVAALACFDQGLSSYQREAVHHYVLRRSAVGSALASLAGQPASLRAGRPGIEPARAPYIVAGALILVSLMEHFGFDECLVSEADILDGLVAALSAGRLQ